MNRGIARPPRATIPSANAAVSIDAASDAILVELLVEASLDQPNPTPELSQALNDVLTAFEHPARRK